MAVTDLADLVAACAETDIIITITKIKDMMRFPVCFKSFPPQKQYLHNIIILAENIYLPPKIRIRYNT